MLGINTSLINKCNIMGDAFKFSVDFYKFDSEKLVELIMTRDSLDWLFAEDNCQEWCDGHFLMSVIANYENPVKGKCADSYTMWFLGYLYKYWMSTRHTSRKEIYRILPFKRFMIKFEFYHTQGWEYIIEDAIKTYNSGNYII